MLIVTIRFSMSKVLRVSTSVFEKLEANVVGFETPSDVIMRAIHSHEELEVLKILVREIISAEESITEMGEREKIILLHHSEGSMHRAIDFIIKIFPQYKITYSIDLNTLVLTIKQMNN